MNKNQQNQENIDDAIISELAALESLLSNY
jgi:hypothetical protein